MTLGRPPSVYTSGDVPLPRAIDDQFLSLDTTQRSAQPDGTNSTMMFTVQNIKFANLLGTILRTVYYPSGEAKVSRHKPAEHNYHREEFYTILELESQLEALADSVPDPLHWGRPNSITNSTFFSGDNEQTFRRQANVLRAR